MTSRYLDHRETDLLDLLRDEIDERGEDLTDWEHDFVEDLLERYEKYAEMIMLSPKQWGVINRILEKMGVI
jgi:hypothetical protein